MGRYALEICCFNLASCIVAVDAGADRIELCMNPDEGGTTPSYGLLRAAREKCRARLYPIIRPRGGDFFYDEDDYAQMITDIQACKDIGCDGIVVGGLLPDGRVDKLHVERLVSAAGAMGVTFHRAFDRSRDPLEALEVIIDMGCERILTSGQCPSAVSGMAQIKELVLQAGNRISIMPGGGVRAENIRTLASGTGALEFHTAARVSVPSMMQYVNGRLQEHLTTVAVHSDEIRQMRYLIDTLDNGTTLS